MAEKGLMSCVAHSEYTNKSRVIHKGPCIVCCVMLAADGAAADCQVYDGENDKGELKAHLESLEGTTFRWQLTYGTDFDYGIYIAVSSTAAKVTVTYTPESRKQFI